MLRGMITANGAQLLSDLPRTNASLTSLRLSGNSQIGGQACVALLTSLQACNERSCQLSVLHIDHCGLMKEHVPSFMEALDQVWVLHELRADGETYSSRDSSRPPTEGGSPFGALAVTPGLFRSTSRSSFGMGGKRPSKPGTPTNLSTPAGAPLPAGMGGMGGGMARWSGGQGMGGRSRGVFSLQQRLSMSKILEDNKTMGPRRVESWRLSRSLEEVAWVFSKLCLNVPPSKVDAGLDSWKGDECAHFVTNIGLPQYASSFAFNLRGPMLVSLKMTNLAQMGVGVFEHQKLIMENVRHLINAFERKERAARANAAWASLLTKGEGGETPLLSRATTPADAPPPSRRTSKRPPPGGVGGLSPPQAVGPRRDGRRRREAPVPILRYNAIGNQQQPAAAGVRLPRIASIKHVDSRGIGLAEPWAHSSAHSSVVLPKPSVLMPPPGKLISPPRSPAEGGMRGGGVGGGGVGGGLGSGGLSGDLSSLAEQAQWRELARTYGLHLVPDSRVTLQDNVQALANAPRPPELPEPPSFNETLSKSAQDPRQNKETLLSNSPSLPMLSPTLLGARNWVTFLHG